MRSIIISLPLATAVIAFLGLSGVASAAGSGMVHDTMNLTNHWGGYVALTSLRCRICLCHARRSYAYAKVKTGHARCRNYLGHDRFDICDEWH